MRSRGEIRAIVKAVENKLAPLGHRVDAIVNYDNFSILPELLDEYSAAVRGLVDRFYYGVLALHDQRFPADEARRGAGKAWRRPAYFSRAPRKHNLTSTLSSGSRQSENSLDTHSIASRMHASRGGPTCFRSSREGRKNTDHGCAAMGQFLLQKWLDVTGEQ